MPPVFASIVEGEGDEAALRPLIENIIASSAGAVYPRIMRPVRAHWGSMVNKAEDLERYAAAALREGGPDARLLVLLDADDRCPAELGPRLRRQLAVRFPNNLVSVSIANREYESWFIASAESIAGHIGATPSPALPDNIEEIRGAKGWLTQNLLSRRYDPIDDQPAFSTYIDVALARQRSRSFDRFCREIERLLVI